jgi:hypothetical protein
MKIHPKYFAFVLLAFIALCSSCSVAEKTSRHGFESGYYKIKSSENQTMDVYLDINDEEISVYPKNENGLGNSLSTIPLSDSDTLSGYPVKFKKTSIDIDLTSIPLKYRPRVNDLPAQMDVGFNLALYAGWRHDNYYISRKEDPLKKSHNSVVGHGYDFGILTGIGSTTIGPFSTNNAVSNDYSGMVLQFGIAGFLESSIASFGIAAGYDYLLSPDRDVWIYSGKPWIGLIIGVALN